ASATPLRDAGIYPYRLYPARRRCAGGIPLIVMTEAVAPRSEPVPGALFAGAVAFVRRLGRNGVRLAAVAAGSALIGCGLVLAVLPGHLGVPLMAVGLIVVLRHSPKARRQFIRLQRRHPRFVFPLRRLIRRDPEVLP